MPKAPKGCVSTYQSVRLHDSTESFPGSNDTLRRDGESIDHDCAIPNCYPASPLLTPPLAIAGISNMEYPDSTKYWAEHRRKKTDVGVQTLHPHLIEPPGLVGPPESGIAALQLPWPHRTACHDPPAPMQPRVIRFSAEQRRVLQLINSGENIFFTGPAGTGKSMLLRHLIQVLKQTRRVAITAPTGIAGVNIGGSTIHSFAGIGLGKEPAEKLAAKIRNSDRLKKRWKSTQVLIIDEISMMDATLFDKLEYIARVVRDCPKPFGGVQLVLSGDFFQLPPVPDQSYEYRMAATYAFDAKSWSTCISQPIFLTEVFRQQDNTFVDILSAIRTGILEAEHVKQLQRLTRPLHYDDGIEPSQIFPLRTEVESCNNSRLAALLGPEYIYHSTDSAGYDYQHQPIPKESANALLDRLVAVPRLSLKISAQVMLIQNIEQGVLVNGSVGKVTEFLTTNEAVARNIRIATLKNGPPPPPEDYIQLRPINDNVFGPREKWPLVHFTSGCELLCAPLEFSVEGFMGNVEAHRLQVPLTLAWALSVHKSQGQTLTRVKVDLGRIFEKGQAYVALSRATTMEHLEVCNFQPSKVMAHPRVKLWQEYWTVQDRDALYEEMDSEEAITRYWDDTGIPSLP